MAKKTLQIRLNQGYLDERIIWNYLDWLDVTTGVLKVEEEHRMENK